MELIPLRKKNSLRQYLHLSGGDRGAMADGVVTIGELAELPSRQIGTAATYTELLHPGQSNLQSLIQFKAEGALEDGHSFMVDVSYGAADVEDHTTIEIQ